MRWRPHTGAIWLETSKPALCADRTEWISETNFSRRAPKNCLWPSWHSTLSWSRDETLPVANALRRRRPLLEFTWCGSRICDDGKFCMYVRLCVCVWFGGSLNKNTTLCDFQRTCVLLLGWVQHFGATPNSTVMVSMSGHTGTNGHVHVVWTHTHTQTHSSHHKECAYLCVYSCTHTQQKKNSHHEMRNIATFQEGLFCPQRQAAPSAFLRQ